MNELPDIALDLVRNKRLAPGAALVKLTEEYGRPTCKAHLVVLFIPFKIPMNSIELQEFSDDVNATLSLSLLQCFHSRVSSSHVAGDAGKLCMAEATMQVVPNQGVAHGKVNSMLWNAQAQTVISRLLSVCSVKLSIFFCSWNLRASWRCAVPSSWVTRW